MHALFYFHRLFWFCVKATANPAEKRQLVKVNESYAVLHAKAAGNEISPDVMAKIGLLVSNIQSRNFKGASDIQAVWKRCFMP